jgi:hypothetical protein
LSKKVPKSLCAYPLSDVCSNASIEGSTQYALNDNLKVVEWQDEQALVQIASSGGQKYKPKKPHEYDGSYATYEYFNRDLCASFEADARALQMDGTFEVVMKQHFDDPNEREHAQTKIVGLKQGKKTADGFFIDFETT